MAQQVFIAFGQVKQCIFTMPKNVCMHILNYTERDRGCTCQLCCSLVLLQIVCPVLPSHFDVALVQNSILP
jgi:hypothetical protein